MYNKYVADWTATTMDFNVGTNGTSTIPGGMPMTFGDNFTQGATGRGVVNLGTGVMATRYENTRGGGLRYRFANGVWFVDASLNRSYSRNAWRSAENGHFSNVTVTLKNPVRLSFLDVGMTKPGSIHAYDNNGTAVDLYDINNYRLTQAQTLTRNISEGINNAGFNVERRLGIFSIPLSLKSGGLIREQTRDSYRRNGAFTYNGINGDTSAAPFRNQVYTSQNSHFGYPGQIAPWVSRPFAYQSWQQNPALFTMTPAQAVAEQAFIIGASEWLRETVTAAYFQAEASFFKNRLRLLTGVRWERTDDNALGPYFEPGNAFMRNADGTFARDSAGRRIRRPEAGAAGSMEELRLIRKERGFGAQRAYDGYYPSLHLTYHLAENTQARLSYARSYGRPNFNEIIPNTSVTELDLTPAQVATAPFPGTISVTNPGLKPWTADNFDFSLEHYTAKGGVFSAVAFVKNIRGFFADSVSLATAADLDRLGLDPEYLGWQLTATYNSPGTARVLGTELNLRHSLRGLTPWGQYFTVFANATNLRTEGNKDSNFSGFIRSSANWGVVFVKNPFLLNAKWNYRGKQKGNAQPAFGPDAYDYAAARISLDLSADYQFSKRVTLTTSIRNLLNNQSRSERYGSATPGYAIPRQAFYSGVYFSVGIKGTF
jgi:TonB-dependent receptor